MKKAVNKPLLHNRSSFVKVLLFIFDDPYKPAIKLGLSCHRQCLIILCDGTRQILLSVFYLLLYGKPILFFRLLCSYVL